MTKQLTFWSDRLGTKLVLDVAIDAITTTIDKLALQGYRIIGSNYNG